MKLFIYLIIGLLFSGCSSKLEPIKQYKFTNTTPSKKVLSKYSKSILKVNYPISVIGKYSKDIEYNYVGLRSGVYLNSKWEDNIGKMIEGALISNLSNSKSFRDVISNKSNINENYSLETGIFDFSNHILANKSYSVISIKFSLVDSKTNSLIKSKRFSYKKEALSLDAKGYVNATNILMKIMLNDLTSWISK